MTKILVVDDEINVRKLYREELENEGYSVVTAKDVQEAIDSVESESPDLVILDIKLGDESGIDALVEIVESRKEIPIIINSAYSVYKENFKTWAADAYIVKSVDLDPLKDKIRELERELEEDDDIAEEFLVIAEIDRLEKEIIRMEEQRYF